MNITEVKSKEDYIQYLHDKTVELSEQVKTNYDHIGRLMGIISKQEKQIEDLKAKYGVDDE